MDDDPRDHSAEGAEITDEVWLILLHLLQRLDPHLASTAFAHAPTPADLGILIGEQIGTLHDEVLQLALANRRLARRVGAMQAGETGSR